MSNTKFYFAEFEIGGALPITDYDLTRTNEERRFDVLMDYLTHSGPVLSTPSGDWYFGRVETSGPMIFGKFGKVFSEEPIQYDEEEGDFIEGEQEVMDADYSLFVIDFENKVIAFSSTYRVRNKNFTTNFVSGFFEVVSSEADFNMELIKTEDNLQQVLEKYPVYKLEAELTPSNPGPNPAFEDLDESLQEMLVEKFGISAERFDGEGINVQQDFIQQVTSMSMSEYGESWRVEYGEGGKLKVVSSESEPASTRVEEGIDSIEDLQNYATELIDTASAYLN